jgi:hypothetical protein
MPRSDVDLTPTDMLIREAQKLARTLSKYHNNRDTRLRYIRRLYLIVAELKKREEA